MYLFELDLTKVSFTIYEIIIKTSFLKNLYIEYFVLMNYGSILTKKKSEKFYPHKIYYYLNITCLKCIIFRGGGWGATYATGLWTKKFCQ